MEMVGMDITRFWFSGPKSRSVNIFPASKFWMIVDVGFVYFEKITFLICFDMYFVNFDITMQYFAKNNEYLVKIHQY